MGMLCAFRWYGGNNPINKRPPEATPPRWLQLEMLDELEALLRKGGQRPTACECLAWVRPADMEPKPGNAAVAMLILRTEEGPLDKPLRTWFVWQHPQWCWSMDPLPELPAQEIEPA